MKNQKVFSYLMPWMVATMGLVACDNYDNGYSVSSMKFRNEFIKKVGSCDVDQDWNIADRANVTVVSSTVRSIIVYTEKDGFFTIVGTFKNVSGTKKLSFDVEEGVQSLVVSDGETAYRTKVGDIVSFNEPAADSAVQLSLLADAPSSAWILVADNMDGKLDIDYNDVVVKVEHQAGDANVYITPLAAGNTLASYLFFGKNCVGEIHQLMGAYPSKSGSYEVLNTTESASAPTSRVKMSLGREWSIATDVSQNTFMGGFSIRILPIGTEAMAKVLNADDKVFKGATTVLAPARGEIPYVLCLPFSYTLPNTPEEGQKTTSVWSWPQEGRSILDAYGNFKKWVKDHQECMNWYTQPKSEYVVSTVNIPAGTSYQSGQAQEMTDYEKEAVATSDSIE